MYTICFIRYSMLHPTPADIFLEMQDHPAPSTTLYAVELTGYYDFMKLIFQRYQSMFIFCEMKEFANFGQILA